MNFATRYREAADAWQLYDNTGPFERRPVAHGAHDVVEIIDNDRWGRFEHAVAHGSRIREVLVGDRPRVPDDHLARCFRDTRMLERAMRIAHARVIRRHQLLNEPLVVGRDGEVVYLDPHTVPIPEGVTEAQMGPVFDYL